jgi:hypothetical protein
MKLNFNWFDGRSFNDLDVVDEDTDQVVGWIASGRQSGIHIYLFDGKYKKVVSTYKECRGFVDGVQEVLDHMTATAVKADSAKQASPSVATIKRRHLTTNAAAEDQRTTH